MYINQHQIDLDIYLINMTMILNKVKNQKSKIQVDTRNNENSYILFDGSKFEGKKYEGQNKLYPSKIPQQKIHLSSIENLILLKMNISIIKGLKQEYLNIKHFFFDNLTDNEGELES